MAKVLTTEEIVKLEQNPHVLSVRRGKISYTPAFQEEAYAQLCAGLRMSEIFRNHGIDPELLGEARVMGAAQKIRAKGKRPEGFADLRVRNGAKVAPTPGGATVEVEVAQLKQELAYTKQEVEFLKKLHQADLEARKEWESKQHPT